MNNFNKVDKINKQLDALRKSKASSFTTETTYEHDVKLDARFIENINKKKKEEKQGDKTPLYHVRVLSDGSGIHRDVVEKLRENVFGDDYVIVENIAQFEKAIERNPFISDYCLIECILSQLSIQDTDKLLSLCNKIIKSRVIFVVDNKNIYDKLDFCRYSFNSYRISENYFNKYLNKRLKNPKLISTENRYKLFNKLRGNYKLLDTVIRRLNNNEDFKKVSRTTKTSSQLSFIKFFNLLLLRDKINPEDFRGYNGAISYDRLNKKFYSFVEDFQFGYKYVYKNLVKSFEKLNEVYKVINNGDLSIFNIHDFCVENKFKEYETRIYYNIAERLSYDRFCLLYEEVINTSISKHKVFTLLFKLYNYDKIKVN